MSTNFYLLLFIPLAIILVLLIKLLRPNKASVSITTKANDFSVSKSILAAENIKLNYEEALEASKQFIYNIIKAVMQKFTPDDIQTLVELGKSLSNAGMQYVHVIDVQALQYEKYISVAKQQTVGSQGVSR